MSEYYRSDCVIAADYVEFDNTDSEFVTIRYKHGKSVVHTVHVMPPENKSFEFYPKMTFGNRYILLEGVNASNTLKSA